MAEHFNVGNALNSSQVTHSKFIVGYHTWLFVGKACAVARVTRTITLAANINMYDCFPY